MDLFEKLSEKLAVKYKDYETSVESENGMKYFVIINPFWNENIRITDDDGIIFFFSFQHAHFDYCDDTNENIKCLIEYIDSYLSENRVVVEFLQDGKNLFGGDGCRNDIDMSSGESILRSFSGDNEGLYKSLYEHIKGLNCRCSIRGWNCVYNNDLDFIL